MKSKLMEAQEAIDKMNNIVVRRCKMKKDGYWFFKSDQKKFGFGMPRKNKKSKRGYSYGTKEERKLKRQRIRAEKHRMLKAGLLVL